MEDKNKKIVIDFAKRSFAVARWAYGMKSLEEDKEMSFTVILLRQKDDGTLGYTVLLDKEFEQPSTLEERLQLTQEISNLFTVHGCCSVLIAQQLTYTNAEKNLDSCCAFHIYDLAGLWLRCFASKIHCVDVFLNNNSPEELIKNKDTGVSEHLTDLGTTCHYVFQTSISEEEKITGPLPAWDKHMEKALKSYRGDPNLDNKWH